MSENTPTPSCPSCGSAMVRRLGPVGPYWGCTSWPACRRTVDILAPSNEHPIARTRRMALAYMRCRARKWSVDDHADAVGDALVSAMRAGWADRVTAWRFVVGRAIRMLQGWQYKAGRKGRYSCRSRTGVQPHASDRLVAPRGVWKKSDDGDVKSLLEPDEWLDCQQAPRTDPVAALDAARTLERARQHGLIGSDDEADAPVALDLLLERHSAAKVARMLGVARSAVFAWQHGRLPSPPLCAKIVARLCDDRP